jgi:nicotinamide riboside transporter PnuC
LIAYLQTQWLTLFISLLSMLMLWLMGNRSIWGPVVGLVNQIVWIIFTIQAKQWGLLPGVIAFTVVHIRNLWLWNKHK